jgi:hypothetical protein
MGGESRKSSRVPYDAELQITWSVEGSHNSGSVRCRDISTGGLRIEAAEPIPVGSYVTLHSTDADLTIAGWVRHCTRESKLCAIGIEYTRSTQDELFGFLEAEEAV